MYEVGKGDAKRGCINFGEKNVNLQFSKEIHKELVPDESFRY